MIPAQQNSIFLHGLESSSHGTKARYFSEIFPSIIIPDFSGSLEQRMDQLFDVSRELTSLTLIGSSYGGLMATLFAQKFPTRLQKIILLAPALNFPDYTPIRDTINVETLIFHGIHDTVCPHDEVLALANEIFSSLTFNSVDDDHMLHSTFRSIPWHTLLPST